VSWKLLVALGKAEDEAKRDASIKNLHRAGVACLLAGKENGSIGYLERALKSEEHSDNIADAIHQSTNQTLLSDLAAAYISSAERNDRPALIANAVEATQRARQLESDPAAAWNRALSLEKIGAVHEAVDAWKAYLRIDRKSQWAAEATLHLQTVNGPLSRDDWPDTLVRMRRATSKNDGAMCDIAAAFPAQTEEYVSDELLPAWAAAPPNQYENQMRLACIRRIAVTLTHSSGRGLLSEQFGAISKAQGDALADLRRGHAAYGSARTAYKADKIAEALRFFLASGKAFREVSSPYQYLAAVGEASCYFFQRDFAAVDAVASSSLAKLRSLNLYPLLGQLEWLKGMAMLAKGNASAARTSYAAAADAFASARDRDGEASIQSLQAELLTYLGDDDAAWSHRGRALVLALSGISARRIQPILSEAAEACLAANNYLAAAVLQNELVAEARNQRQPAYLCDALLGRGTAHLAGNDRLAAERDIDEARRIVAMLPDADMRSRTEANLNLLEAEAILRHDPHRSMRLAEDASSSFARVGERFRYGDALLIHARAAQRIGQEGQAEKDLYAAVADMQHLQTLSGQLVDRFRFAARRAAIGTELVRVLLRRGATTEALLAHDQLCATALGDAYKSPSGDNEMNPVAALQHSLPPAAVVIVYVVDDTATLAWLIQRDAIAFAHTTTPAATLNSAVYRFNAAVSERRFDDQANELLYAILIAPFEPKLTRITRVFVIPDGSLNRLAFAAVRHRGLFLPERFALATAPNLSILAESRRRCERLRAKSVRSAVVALLDDEGLREAEAETTEVASNYPGAVVLRNTAGEELFTAIAHCDVVHLIGHAESRERSPFGGRFRGNGQVRPLTSENVLSGPQLQGPIVVLAGCQTRVSAIYGHEGTAAIADAFLAKGAAAVLATMWDVEDVAARSMSVSFHRRFAAGSDALAALQQTQVEMIRRHEPPIFWAAYQFVGGG
jgi:CHAT domain-containing protein